MNDLDHIYFILIFAVFVFSGLTELALPGNMFFDLCRTVLPVFAGIMIGWHLGKS